MPEILEKFHWIVLGKTVPLSGNITKNVWVTCFYFFGFGLKGYILLKYHKLIRISLFWNIKVLFFYLIIYLFFGGRGGCSASWNLRKYKENFTLGKYNNFFNFGARKFHSQKYNESFAGWIFLFLSAWA